jgi:AcrR family transcriptional regulator
MRLFAERGYERTSVPEIQRAAGLTPGSGAMYKHYASKESVLTAAVDQYVQQARAARGALRSLEMPPEQVLDWMGRQTMDILASKYDELRILWRDVERVPRLQAKARREIMQASYAAVATWLRERIKHGDLPEQDADAAAAVVLGSITMFRVFEALWGERTIAVSDERFIRAWHRIIVRGLGLTPQGAKSPKRRRKR